MASDDRKDPRKLLDASRRLIREGSGDEALKSATDALAIFQSAGDTVGQADAECARVRALLELGQVDEAAKAAQEGLTGVKRSGERSLGVLRRREAPMHLATAEVQLKRGDADMAMASTTKAHSYFQGVGEKGGAAEAQLVVARAHLQKKVPRDAVKAAEAARTLFQGCTDRHGEVATLKVVLDAHMLDGKYRDAMQAAEVAQRLCAELGEALGAMHLQQQVAEALLRSRQSEEALTAARRAMVLATEANCRKEFAEALMLTARAHLAQQETSHAIDATQEALSIFKQLGDKKKQADVGLELSHMLMQKGKLDDATRHAESAQRIFKDLSDKSGKKEVNETLCTLELAPDIIESRQAKVRFLIRKIVRAVSSRDVFSFKQAVKEMQKAEYKPMVGTRDLQVALEPQLISDPEGTVRFLRANGEGWPELAAIEAPRTGGLQDWTMRFFAEA